MMIPTGDVRSISPAEQAASKYLFSIPTWEIENFLDKWVHRFGSFFTGGGMSDEEKAQLIANYTELSERIRQAEDARNRGAADLTSDDELEQLELALSTARNERGNTRNAAEEYLESEVSATLREFGFGGALGTLWPPVDFRLESPPHVLVTSPRDHIERLESELLSPDINAIGAEEVEARLLERNDLSAVVLSLGGVATYPTFVRDDNSLLATLDLAAHEWLHAYFFFNPLGQNINSSADMNTLNETIASLAGEEIGIITYERLTGKTLERPEESGQPGENESEFSFDAFMRETRLRTDELLADRKVEEAEAFMEARRVELQEHGFFIRKLNQAWFAFHGTYGDSPASVSPIGAEVEELRSLVPDVGELIRRTRGVSSYSEFQEVLAEVRQQAPAE